jgi:hypothetical protein
MEESVAYWREKAEECLRLARESTNPALADQLDKLAAAYLAAVEEILNTHKPSTKIL